MHIIQFAYKLNTCIEVNLYFFNQPQLWLTKIVVAQLILSRFHGAILLHGLNARIVNTSLMYRTSSNNSYSLKAEQLNTQIKPQLMTQLLSRYVIF